MIKRMATISLFCSALALSFLLTSTATVCSAGEVYQMNSASMGGTIYRFMAAASKVLNEELKDVQFAVRTGSPKENILLLENKEIIIGGVSPHDFLYLHPEDKKFEKTNIRTLWPMFNLCRWLVVPKDSPVQTLDDLKGKKIVVGIKTGEGIDFLKMVEAVGWKEKDMNFFYIGKDEGIAAYKDGTVDAWAGWSTVPSPHFMELASSRKGARIIPLKDAEVQKILHLYPSYVPGVVPAGSHKEITADAATIYTWYHMVTREGFPDDVGYKIAKALDTKKASLVEMFKGAATSTAENAAKYPFFKLNAGVEKYLKEKGLK